jgi:hypothetical protein
VDEIVQATFDGSRPFPFLDSHIKVGDSLLGTTPALLRENIPDAAFAVLGDDDKSWTSKMRQLANTMKAIHDAHVARGELKQALILEAAVRDELRQFMETLPQAAIPAGIRADAPVAARSAVDRAAEVESDAATLAVTAAVGPELAQVWQADPAWAALETRIVDLVDDGLDPVATVRLAYGQRGFEDAESAVQVMTWRIDGLVRDHRAPGVSGTNDSEVTAALEALKAMTHGTADQAVRSPLPNPLEPRRPTQASSQTTATATDAEIGD